MVGLANVIGHLEITDLIFLELTGIKKLLNVNCLGKKYTFLINKSTWISLGKLKFKINGDATSNEKLGGKIYTVNAITIKSSLFRNPQKFAYDS